MDSDQAKHLAKDKLLEYMVDKKEIIRANKNRFVFEAGKFRGKWEVYVEIYPKNFKQKQDLGESWKCVGPEVQVPNEWLRAVIEDDGTVMIHECGDFDDLINC